MTYRFLSDEWITAARALRTKYEGESPQFEQVIRVNQIITDTPFDGGVIHAYLDTSSGRLELDLGTLDDADATMTTDYVTARVLLVDQDPAALMQAFLGGKIVIQGDIVKLLSLQSMLGESNAAGLQLATELQSITL